MPPEISPIWRSLPGKRVNRGAFTEALTTNHLGNADMRAHSSYCPRLFLALRAGQRIHPGGKRVG